MQLNHPVGPDHRQERFGVFIIRWKNNHLPPEEKMPKISVHRSARYADINRCWIILQELHCVSHYCVRKTKTNADYGLMKWQRSQRIFGNWWTILISRGSATNFFQGFEAPRHAFDQPIDHALRMKTVGLHRPKNKTVGLHRPKNNLLCHCLMVNR